MARRKAVSTRRLRHEITLALIAKAVALAALYLLFFVPPPAPDLTSHLFTTEQRR
jgi:hypothetical protein